MDKRITKQFLNEFGSISFETVFWDGETMKIGGGDPEFRAYFHKPLKAIPLIRSTSLSLGELYMNGDIEIDGDLYQALDVFLSQFQNFSTTYRLLPKIFHKSFGLKTEKHNISHHYDLGNEFYKLWLDETLSYSCGYFIKDTDTLYDAQMNKIHYILKKIQLKEGEWLLDIGCGFGSLLIEAAKKYKANCVGITLSKEQYRECMKKIKAQHLENQIQIFYMNYQELSTLPFRFDKIVSVGMLEHVGREQYPYFFQQINSVLKDKGVLLLHFISSLKESDGDAFIKKYIFPGGIIPTLREIISTGTNYAFHTLDVESLRLHYNKTLLCWYHNFNRNLPTLEKEFETNFIRMWQLYLASCAAMFHTGYIDLHQVVFSKGANNGLETTRHHLYQ